MKAIFMAPEPIRMKKLDHTILVKGNYEPGLYIVEVSEDNSKHYVIVFYEIKTGDKQAYFIGSLDYVNLPLKDVEEIFPGEGKPVNSDKQEFPGLVSESFALEFSKILLNRK